MSLFDIDNLNWMVVKARFERDFKASPTICSVISKLPEIRQKDNESVNQYVSRCAEILLELKAKTDVVEANIQLTLTDEDTALYTGIEVAARARITREIKLKTQAILFNLISGFHLIAGFKAEIRAGLMKKEGQLTSIALIKDEAMQIELILEEKKKKSQIGTNGNGSTTVLVNQIDNEDQNNIDAIRQTGYKGQNYNPNHQANKNNSGSNGPAKCAHCKKLGHTV